MVAPGHLRFLQHQGVDHFLAQGLAAGPLAHHFQGLLFFPVVLVQGREAFLDRDRQLGLAVGHRAQGLVPVGVEHGVVQDDLGVVVDLGLEVGAVVAEGHFVDAAQQAHVVAQVQGGLDDHPQAAVAADGAVEQLTVVLRAGVHHLAVGQHQLDGFHRAHQRAVADVAAMGVDAQGAADGEVGVALHDAHGQVVGVDVVLHGAPSDARLHGDFLALFGEVEHLVEAAHVDLQGVLGGGLAAHAVAPAADGDGPGVLGHLLDDLLQAGGAHHLIDHDGVELGDVVDGFCGVGGECIAECRA